MVLICMSNAEGCMMFTKSLINLLVCKAKLITSYEKKENLVNIWLCIFLIQLKNSLNELMEGSHKTDVQHVISYFSKC